MGFYYQPPYKLDTEEEAVMADKTLLKKHVVNLTKNTMNKNVVKHQEGVTKTQKWSRTLSAAWLYSVLLNYGGPSNILRPLSHPWGNQGLEELRPLWDLGSGTIRRFRENN